MNSGAPPTAVNARTGLSTPPGRIRSRAGEETGGSVSVAASGFRRQLIAPSHASARAASRA